MSIGDKILQARKDAGLSQEQLAQQMGIELESLSRWEDNTELPDRQQTELLEQILAAQLQQELPLEEISYVHKSEHLGQLGKEADGFDAPYIRIVLITLAAFTALCPFASSAFLVSLSILIGLALGWLIGMPIRKRHRKKARANYEGTEYSLRIFADRFEMLCRKDGNEYTYRAEFAKLKLAKTGAMYTIFRTDRIKYHIPNHVIEASAILSAQAEEGRKKYRHHIKCCIALAILLALSAAAVMVMYEYFFDPLSKSGGLARGIAALALILLPVAAIVLSAKKLLSTAPKVFITIYCVTCIFGLALLGLLTLVLGSVHSDADEVLIQLEELTDVSVPQYAFVNKRIFKDKDFEGQNMRPQRSWAFSFDEYKAQGLDSQLARSKIWRESSNPTLDTIFGSYMLVEGWDYLAIYEPETGRVNRRPEEDGTYTFMIASYDRDEGVLCIVEYELDYSITEKTEVL